MKSTDIEALQRVLGHVFGKPDLLSSALTHRSLKKNHNERLEFLGDALLGFIISNHLYRAFKDASEGVLSHLRSVLVKRKTLAEIARELTLGQHLNLGLSEAKSGGFDRDSIVADAVEAVIAAIYLDAGYEACERCVLQWYRRRLDDPDLVNTQKDAKSQLQEYCQSQRLPLPCYRLVSTEGAAHALSFTVSCEVKGIDFTTVQKASTRRQAEQAVASEFLQRLHDAKDG